MLPRKLDEGETSFRAWLSRTLSGTQGKGLRRDRRLLAFALIGLVMGTFFDAFHVFTGTAEYRRVWKFPALDVAWYVPVEFTIAGIVVGMVRPVLDERFGGPNGRLTCTKAAAGILFLALAWGGSGVLTHLCWPPSSGLDGSPIPLVNPNLFYLIGLLAVGAAAWYQFDRTFEGIVVAQLTAAIGVSLELYLIHVDGSYRYLHADFHGVPSWLPALYVIACGSIGNFGRFLKQRTGPPACLSRSR